MLTIGRLGRGQESYYLEKVAHGIEDYYTLSGEPPGEWLGAGAVELGLSGRVDDAGLHAVLQGYDPTGGLPLVIGAGHPKRRPGFDLTFSAPKGISLLGLLGPSGTRAAVMASHRDAVAQVVDYLDRHAAWVRRGHGGTEHEGASGLVGAAFIHRSSRSADPQIHTHVLVANLGRGEDGRWTALFGKVLYREARTAGFLYQAALRDSLTRSLGIEWQPVVRGLAEPADLPSALLRAFSTRRAEIEAALQERGASSARSAQVAAYRTRSGKDPALVNDDLPARWRAEAVERGVDLQVLERVARSAREPRLDLADHVDDLLGPKGLTEHESSFDRRSVLRALAELAGDGASVDRLETLADQLLVLPELVRLRPRPGEPDPARWTTQELLALESQVVERAARRSSSASAVPAAVIDSVLAVRPTLDEEQSRVVRGLLDDTSAVKVVVGPAGTGKTYVLDAARAGWQESGHHVVGVALAGRAAAELSSGAGITATTLARFLADGEDPGGVLPSRTVVLLDEAGMVGTRALSRLFEVAARDGARIVLIGDPRQLPEIEAGGVIRGLVDRIGALELTSNRRQEMAWERDVLAELRAGDVGVAVDAYKRNGRLVYADTVGEARGLMVADWFASRQAGARAVMLAIRRSDVDELNGRARIAMRGAGLLGDQELAIGGRRFAVGDEVMPLRNDRKLGVVNGVRTVVVDVDQLGGRLAIGGADGSTVLIPAGYLDQGHLGHAYASTIHKAQGLTVDRAFLLGSDALYREAGYVGLSRARQRTDLYLVAGRPEPELVHGRSNSDKTDPVGELLWALRQSRAQELASEGLERGLEPDLPSHERETGVGRIR